MTRILNILITNIQFFNHTGTETAVRDLALGLHKAGHNPTVYSPKLGDMANEVAFSGIPVINDLRNLTHEPDIIHGHHHVETVRALMQFPRAYGIFVCHARLSWQDLPPIFSRILRYVAVDQNCLERLTGIPEDRKQIIYNCVDTNRFLPRPPLPKTPKRALIFSNYATVKTHLEPLREACQKLNITLDVIGYRSGNGVTNPEEILGKYDLVFAKARCAIEAMATGAAVVLCDRRGLGPMVTSGEVDKLRQWNFGMRCLNLPLEPSRIIQEIRKYDPEDAFAVSKYIRENANLSSALDQYMNLYEEVLAENRPIKEHPSDEIGEYLFFVLRKLDELKSQVAELKGYSHRHFILAGIGNYIHKLSRHLNLSAMLYYLKIYFSKPDQRKSLLEEMGRHTLTLRRYLNLTASMNYLKRIKESSDKAKCSSGSNPDEFWEHLYAVIQRVGELESLCASLTWENVPLSKQPASKELSRNDDS